jgi:hypothetical protein
MNAVNIDVTISLEDGMYPTWEWMWTFTGDQPAGQVHEELLILDSHQRLINAQTYEAHTADPGITYLGNGRGLYPLPRDDNTYWSFRVFHAGEYLGESAGIAHEPQTTYWDKVPPPPNPGWEQYPVDEPTIYGSADYSDAAAGGYEQPQDPGSGWTSG